MIHKIFRLGLRRAAGALIFDPSGRLLLVRDRLRREWSYPGGYLDWGESALEACAREIREEVAIAAPSERFALVDTHPLRRPLGTLTFTTFEIHISVEEAAAVRLQARELTDFRWVTRAEALELVTPRLRERLREVLAETTAIAKSR